MTDELTALLTKLAASEARERQLREALKNVRYFYDPTSEVKTYQGMERIADIALSLPTDDSALREVCLRVAVEARDGTRTKSLEDIVDWVLEGRS